MYKALVSFSGVESMQVGEVKDLADLNIVKDLLRAGYIEEIKPAKKVSTAKTATTKKRTTKK